MEERLFATNVAPLRAVFPLVTVSHKNVRAKDPRNTQRIKDELQASNIEGRTWIEITVTQARASWDILELIQPSSLPIIFPGYLQWLWNDSEADVMMHGLPLQLLHTLNQPTQPYNRQQIEGLVSFLQSVLDRARPTLERKEVAVFAEALRVANNLACPRALPAICDSVG